MKATAERVASTATVLALWALWVESVARRFAATDGMPSSADKTLSSMALSAMSLMAQMVRLGRFVTSSTPFLSRMRPRGAAVVTVLVRLDSACLV